jgi:hypothetical protein
VRSEPAARYWQANACFGRQQWSGKNGKCETGRGSRHPLLIDVLRAIEEPQTLPDALKRVQVLIISLDYVLLASASMLRPESTHTASLFRRSNEFYGAGDEHAFGLIR